MRRACVAVGFCVALSGAVGGIGVLGGATRVTAEAPEVCSTFEVQLCFTTSAFWYTNPSGGCQFDTTGTFLFKQEDLNTIDYKGQNYNPVFNNTQKHGTLLPAQDKTHTIGASGTHPFEAAFTGWLSVPTAGNLSLEIFSDDGFYIGFGTDEDGNNQPTYVSGPTGGPSTTFRNGYPVQVSDTGCAGAFPFTINFPAPGEYRFEIEYAENSAPPGDIIFADSSGTAIDNQ